MWRRPISGNTIRVLSVHVGCLIVVREFCSGYSSVPQFTPHSRRVNVHQEMFLFDRKNCCPCLPKAAFVES